MNFSKNKNYNSEIPSLFFEMCKKGMSLTQIASALEIEKETLMAWSKDTDYKKREFKNAWVRGKEACQAYHETLLDKMIRQDIKASSSEIEAQKYRLRVMFREDWSDKQESKVEISHVNNMSDEDLQAELKKMLVRSSARTLLANIPKTDNKDGDSDQVH